MDDAALVGRDQGFGALSGDIEKLIQAHRLTQPLSQGLALNVFHDQEDLALIFKYVVNGGDLGIAEAGNARGFLLEPATVDGIST